MTNTSPWPSPRCIKATKPNRTGTPDVTALTCTDEVFGTRNLLHALREFEAFYNEHRPHQGIANARPVRPLPPPITSPDQIADLEIQRHQRLGGILHEYKHAA